MMWSVQDNHLYVFWNGTLIYKRRHPTSGHGYVFDAFGPPWRPYEFDQDMERLTDPQPQEHTNGQ